MTTLEDIQGRARVRTAYLPQEFREAYENAESLEEQGEIRELLRSIDDGRFYEMLDAAHRVLARSDGKRRSEFVENYSDHLILWIKAFGEVEDLNTFERIEV